jgi:hypothetical protein
MEVVWRRMEGFHRLYHLFAAYMWRRMESYLILGLLLSVGKTYWLAVVFLVFRNSGQNIIRDMSNKFINSSKHEQMVLGQPMPMSARPNSSRQCLTQLISCTVKGMKKR